MSLKFAANRNQFMRGSAKHLALLALLLPIGCEIDTRLKVSKENPPKFIFTGRVGLAQFFVSGPYTLDELKLVTGQKGWAEENLSKVKSMVDRKLWQLDPAVRALEAEIHPIAYGIVPPGFSQVYPTNNQPAAPLLEGRYYRVIAARYSSDGRNIDFVIQNGKAVEVSLE
jgi:hypothetical protein